MVNYSARGWRQGLPCLFVLVRTGVRCVRSGENTVAQFHILSFDSSHRSPQRARQCLTRFLLPIPCSQTSFEPSCQPLLPPNLGHSPSQQSPFRTHDDSLILQHHATTHILVIFIEHTAYSQPGSLRHRSRTYSPLGSRIDSTFQISASPISRYVHCTPLSKACHGRLHTFAEA